MVRLPYDLRATWAADWLVQQEAKGNEQSGKGRASRERRPFPWLNFIQTLLGRPRHPISRPEAARERNDAPPNWPFPF